jgi:hypothetical protein
MDALKRTRRNSIIACRRRGRRRVTCLRGRNMERDESEPELDYNLACQMEAGDAMK